MVKVFTSKVDDKISAQMPIDSISQFNNFCFTEAGLRVWKAYSVGEGKLLDPSKLDKVTPPALTLINAAASGSSFQPIKPRRGRLQTDHSESEEEEDVGIESPSAESQAPALFFCPKGGGVRVYMRYKNLENHLACGNHKRISDKETFHDKTDKGSSMENVYLF